MAYDPFDRGPFPVGVRSARFEDAARAGRVLELEIWYPAAEAHAGEDRADGTRDVYRVTRWFPAATQDAVRDARVHAGPFPLLAFSHGWGGHRRQSTFLCTHLASHGFVVAAVDHTGNTVVDLMSGAARDRGSVSARAAIETRPPDLAFALDRVLDGAAGDLARSVAREQIGAFGHSYGGWTALALAGVDARVDAVVALAPAGGSSPFADVEALRPALEGAARRSVPTLLVVADCDAVRPLGGMYEIFASLAGQKRMVVLTDVDHFHFLDAAANVHALMRRAAFSPFDRIAAAMRPMEELVPERYVHAAVSGLAVAHFQAALTGSRDAGRFLAADLAGALASRGARARVVGGDAGAEP
jgi:predicted dienelactone hydrolase